MTAKDKWFYGIAAGLMFCVIVFCFLAVWYPIPESGKDHSNTILGFFLGTVLGTIIGVIYGTSKTSQERSEMQLRKDAADGGPSIDDLHKQLNGGK
jgi:hypothetical protein